MTFRRHVVVSLVSHPSRAVGGVDVAPFAKHSRALLGGQHGQWVRFFVLVGILTIWLTRIHLIDFHASTAQTIDLLPNKTTTTSIQTYCAGLLGETQGADKRSYLHR